MPWLVATAKLFENKLLHWGITPTDSVEVIRQKQLILLVHYIFLFFGPLVSLFLMLSSKMFVLVLITLIIPFSPIVVSFCVYCLTRKVKLATYTICVASFVVPTVVGFLSGNIVNLGFSTQMIFISPLMWLCITRRFLPSFLLFLAASTVVPLHVALSSHNKLPDFFQQQVPAEMLPWHWWCNAMQMQCFNFVVYVYVLNEAVFANKAQQILLDRSEKLSKQMVDLDIDSLTKPTAQSSNMEFYLYNLMLKIRRWKSYIPRNVYDEKANTDEDDSMVGSFANPVACAPPLHVRCSSFDGASLPQVATSSESLPAQINVDISQGNYSSQRSPSPHSNQLPPGRKENIFNSSRMENPLQVFSTAAFKQDKDFASIKTFSSLLPVTKSNEDTDDAFTSTSNLANEYISRPLHFKMSTLAAILIKGLFTEGIVRDFGSYLSESHLKINQYNFQH